MGYINYGCFLDGYAAQLYLEDTMKQAKSWFGDIIEIARQKDVSNNNGYHIEVITDIFTSVKSIVEAIVKGIVREYCQRYSSACKLSCPTCKVVFEIFGTDN